MTEKVDEESQLEESATPSADEDSSPAAQKTNQAANEEAGELARLNALAEELTRERDELKDILVRKQAEFENFRKRTERERSEFVQFASAQVVEGILEVLDSFELALRDGTTDQNAASLHQGFELIFKQLFDSLDRQGLKAVEAEGQEFDPHVHQAVSTQPSAEVPAGMVLEELRKGYTLNGRLLRPAMVVVAAAPTEVSRGKDESDA